MATRADWYCRPCHALRRARWQWGPAAHLLVWGTPLAALAWPPLWLVWPLVIAGSGLAGRRVCAVCGHPHLIHGRQLLRDHQARQSLT